MNPVADNRPKFLTKKEREELAKKKEEEEKQKELAKEQEIKNHRKEILHGSKNREEDRHDRHDKHHTSSRDESSRHRDRRRSKSRSRSKEKERHKKPEPKKDEKPIISDEKEIEDIKNQYLGTNKDKKKLVKPSEKYKNKFQFEWDNEEDTSRDSNPLYANRLEPSLLFGKGKLGGVDIEAESKRGIDRHEEVKTGSRYTELGDNVNWQKKSLSEMSDRDWRIFREDHDIRIKGGRVPPCIRSWEEANLPDYINEAIRTLRFKKPTPIQLQAIPIGLEKKDLIGIAPTGSGKTAAYLIPFINYLCNLPPMTPDKYDDGPYGLILCPTRELALQVFSDFEKFAMGTRLRGTCVVGGRSMEEQAFTIRKGVEVMIGTPGRIKDAIESRHMTLNQCTYVVIDEADRMVDVGSDLDLPFILDSIPKENMKSTDETEVEQQEKKCKAGQQFFRVTHMFSATMPNFVEKIARKYLRHPAYISIGEPGSGKKEIEQRVFFMDEAEKKHRLRKVLDRAEAPIIIFLNEKRAVELLAKTLEKWGWKAIIYHGGKTQEQREAAVQSFRDRKYDILVATDLAGRGLDVEGVKYVINFDAPKTLSDFIHRTGRTGRAGRTGIAVTFITNRNEELFYDLKNFLQQNGHVVPPELADHPATKIKPGTMEVVPRRKQVIFAQ